MNPAMQVHLTGCIPTGSWPPVPLRRLQDHPIFAGTAHRWQQRLEGLVETHTFIPSAKGFFPWDVEKMEQAKSGEIIEPSIRNGAHDGSWLCPRSKGALAASQHHWYDIIFSYEILWTLGHAEAWWILFLSLSSSYQLGFQRLWWVSQKCQTLPWLLKSPLVCPQLPWGSPRKERRLRRSRRRRSNWVSFGGVVLFRGLVVSLEFNKWLGEPQKNDFLKSTSSLSIAAKTILSHSCCIPCGFAKGICQGQKLAELHSLRKTHVKI